jgi:HEAT repeat protein
MMRGLRHGPERAAAPDWPALTAIMRPLTRDHQAGCRRWAVRELGILRDPDALDDLLAAVQDPEPLVRSEARASLGMLGQAAPATRQAILDRLTFTARHAASSEARRNADRAIEEIA